MAVSLAIKNKRLVQSVVRDTYGNPKIADPDLADREWLANSDYTDAPQRLMPPSEKADDWGFDDPPPDRGESSGDMGDASTRAKYWQAKKYELQFKEAAGELVKAADVQREWAGVLTLVKTRVLGIPTRLKQALPELSLSQIGALETLLREALEGVADDQAESADGS